MTKVELHPAWWCYCDACGVENYIRPMVEELTADDAADVEDAGLPVGDMQKITDPGHDHLRQLWRGA